MKYLKKRRCLAAAVAATMKDAFTMPSHTTSSAERADRQIVTALVRGLNLLACFRVERPMLSNAELSRLSGLPKSSVSRLTHTLVKEGYLEYDSRRRGYRLGPKVLSIGRAMLGGMLLRDIALPHMQQLADRSDSQVAIATCEEWSVLVIEVATASAMQAYPMEVGARMTIDTTAMGRVHLASSSSAERQRLLHYLVHERGRDLAVLKETVERCSAELRQYGYCTSINEWRAGVNGVAVPLYLPSLGRRLVLTCGGKSTQLTKGRIHDEIGPMLIKAARSIEQACDQQY